MNLPIKGIKLRIKHAQYQPYKVALLKKKMIDAIICVSNETENKIKRQKRTIEQ